MHAKRSEPPAGTLRDIIALGRFPFLLAGAILFLLGAAVRTVAALVLCITIITAVLICSYLAGWSNPMAL
jgi:uncharacterized membrane protein YphA (DoxX/SURF4 family)